MKTAICVAAIAVSGSLVAHSQGTQPANQQFRAGVELVALDFLAIDDEGRPVLNLKPAEITLKVDGKARQIKNLQFFKLATTSVEQPVAPPKIDPPYVTNGSSVPGRAVIFVIDQSQLGIGDGKWAIASGNKLIDRLAASDRVGVVTMPQGKVEADLTMRHDLARKALESAVGQGQKPLTVWNIGLSEAVGILGERFNNNKPITQQVIDRECSRDTSGGCAATIVTEGVQMAQQMELATRTSLSSLKDFLDGIAGVDGPKSVIFMSGQLINFNDTFQDIGEVARAASASRAQLYVLQPDHPTFASTGRDEPPTMEKDMDLQREGLQDLASRTGGVFRMISGNGETLFTKIADETSAYYLLGFEPTPGERDGKLHKIDLVTTRKGVTVRTRPGFVIDKRTDVKPLADPADVANLLKEVKTHKDVPLRATAYAARSADRANIKIVAVLETIDPDVTLSSAAFALIDLKGRVAAQWTEEGVNVVKRPIISAAELPAGAYRLRVAAADTTGKTGAVDYEFPAELTNAGPLKHSTLMLGVWQPASGKNPDGTALREFKPRLQPNATDTVTTSYMEIYGTPPAGQPLSVMYELAETPDGPALSSRKAFFEFSADPDRFVSWAQLPIDALKPGDYVVRGIIMLNGKEVGRALRAVRKPAS